MTAGRSGLDDTGLDDTGLDDTGLDDAAIDEAVAVLQRGGLIGLPTETVYGLGADASNPAAVARVFEVKGRPAGHPLIVHLADAGALDAWAAEVPAVARRLAEAFWPGPLTIVVRRSARVLDEVTGGRDTVALRVPGHPVALEVLRRFGGGIAAPSANRFGRVSPTRAAHVTADLGDAVDLVLDGGPSVVGIESTIVDVSGGRMEVLRLGAITAEQLASVAGEAAQVADEGAEPRAPGMHAAHYSPAAEVRLTDMGSVVASADALVREGRTVGALAPTVIAGLPSDVVELEPAGDAEHFASVLYDRLRQADRLAIDVLLVVPPPGEGMGAAVRDRLGRAATGSATR